MDLICSCRDQGARTIRAAIVAVAVMLALAAPAVAHEPTPPPAPAEGEPWTLDSFMATLEWSKAEMESAGERRAQRTAIEHEAALGFLSEVYPRMVEQANAWPPGETRTSRLAYAADLRRMCLELLAIE